MGRSLIQFENIMTVLRTETVWFLLILLPYILWCGAIHEYMIDFFVYEPVKTEYIAYQALKESPLQASVDYIAIPWSVLINQNCLARVQHLRFNGGFTICQHVNYEKVIPLLKCMGISVLFASHARSAKCYDKIMVLPLPHVAPHGAAPAELKNIFYSFVGVAFTHPLRKKLFAIKHAADCIVIERSSWHWRSSLKQQEWQKNEYKDILSRSRYALCPPGAGPNTLRFWEALQAGAIPVVFGDTSWLPSDFDWHSCVVFMNEKDISKVDRVLRAISCGQELEMRKNCLHAYKRYGDRNIISVIQRFYEGDVV